MLVILLKTSKNLCYMFFGIKESCFDWWFGSRVIVSFWFFWCLLYDSFEMPLSMVLTSRSAVLQFKYLLAQGARYIKNSLWFVAAVLLCWVCCHFKALLRHLKCSEGPFFKHSYSVSWFVLWFRVLWNVSWPNSLLVVEIQVPYSGIRSFIPQNFTDPFLFSKILVILLVFSFPLTLLLYSQCFRCQMPIANPDCRLCFWPTGYRSQISMTPLLGFH